MTLRLRLTRRQAVIAAGGSLATVLARADALVLAQDDATPAPAAVGTPSAGAGLIKPTGLGPVPSTGASRPSKILSKVDLPAPLLPTRPMVPGSKASVTSLSAWVGPKLRLTCWISTSGMGAPKE